MQILFIGLTFSTHLNEILLKIQILTKNDKINQIMRMEMLCNRKCNEIKYIVNLKVILQDIEMN